MRYLRLLTRADTLALWGGQLTSVMGDRLYAMAVLWLVLQMTGSAQLMALVSLSQSLPLVVVGLLAGGLVDSWDRFRGMVGIDVLRALCVAAIPLDYALGTMAPWHFVVVGAVLGSLEALFAPSLQASLPAVVEADDLQAVIGLMDTTSRFAQILGPGSAGLLLLWLPEQHFFTLDALTFAASAASLAFVGHRLHARGAAQVRRGGRVRVSDWRGGFDAVRADAGLATGISLRVLCNAANAAFTIGAPVLVATRFHDGIAQYGLILGAYGAGSLIGNVLAGNLQFGSRVLSVFSLAWGAMGLGLLVVAWAPALWIALLAVLWMGLFGSMQHVSMELTIARRVDRGTLGRVYALQRVAMSGASSLGLLVAGMLLGRMGATGTLALAGGIEVAGAAGALVVLRVVQRAPLPTPVESR